MPWSGQESGKRSPERIVFQMSSEREREQKINHDSDILKGSYTESRERTRINGLIKPVGSMLEPETLAQS